MMNDDNSRLSSTQAATYIGIADPTLRIWRSRGKGPDFYRIGGRVYYDMADIQRWLSLQRNTSAA